MVKVEKVKMKVCPDCKTAKYLAWSIFVDGTTDCMMCGGNYEEDELKTKMVDGLEVSPT